MLIYKPLLIYFLFYSFTFYSVIGYGWIFSKILSRHANLNLGYLGIYGLFLLAFYSYVSHHFFAHHESHNLVLISLGFLLYLYFLIKFSKNYLKNHFLLLLTVILIFISSLLAKNHDDFSYYHFSYTYFLTQKSSLFGIGVFNHGYRTPSSIFYIGSLFYLPIIKYYAFHFVSVFVLITSNFILIKKIIYFYRISIYNFIFYLCLLSFLFINIKFGRIGEHGTDISAQILVLILIIELLSITNIKNYYLNNSHKIFILIGLIVTFKAFFILYFIFIFYLFYFLIKKYTLKKLFFLNWHLYWCIALIFFSLFATFQNTGCFLYPIKNTCFWDLKWGIKKEEVILMSNWYELWSKGGAAPNFRVENPDKYIQGFNWVSGWFKIYFFNKVSDTLGGILAICILVFGIFYNKEKSIKITRRYTVVLALIFLLLLEWFMIHPALRYGGYCLVALLFFIPISLLLEKYKKNYMRPKIIIIFFVTILIFCGRNIYRIDQESKKYNYNPILSPYYIVTQDFFRIFNDINELILNFNNCQISNTKCIPSTVPNVELLYDKYVFINFR